MLSKILSREECSKCRICCQFDDSDLWETPVIYNDIADSILKINPKQEFLETDINDHNKIRVLKLNKENELYPCTMLDKDKGCMLSSEDKPFDCKIWPLRVMKKDDSIVITLSPVCPVVAEKPIEDVKNVVNELSDLIFDQARLHPEIIKDYIDGYKILASRSLVTH